MRRVRFFISVMGVIVLLGGCTSARRAYRTLDGQLYGGFKDAPVVHKFFVRSIEFKNTTAQIPPARMAEVLPGLFSATYDESTIPIRIVVTYGSWNRTPQFLYPVISLLTLTFIPYEVSQEITAGIDIYSDDGSKLVPSFRYVTADDEKTSYLLFLGSFSYGPKAGFQYYAWGDSLSQIVYDKKCVDQFVEFFALCVAQQLKTYARDRIVMPEIKFEL